MHAKGHLATGHPGDAHRMVMHATLKLCFDKTSFGPNAEAAKDIGHRAWRAGTWQLLQDLPGIDQPLADWGTEARGVIVTFLEDTGWPCKLTLSSNLRACNAPAAAAPIRDFLDLTSDREETPCAVIHQAKAQSHDAVMVVCGKGKRGRPSDLEHWLQSDKRREEEKRVGYVAMTRARKLLVLAIPDTEDAALVDQLRQHFLQTTL